MFIKSKNIIPYSCIAVVGILCIIGLGVDYKQRNYINSEVFYYDL